MSLTVLIVVFIVFCIVVIVAIVSIFATVKYMRSHFQRHITQLSRELRLAQHAAAAASTAAPTSASTVTDSLAFPAQSPPPPPPPLYGTPPSQAFAPHLQTAPFATPFATSLATPPPPPKRSAVPTSLTILSPTSAIPPDSFYNSQQFNASALSSMHTAPRSFKATASSAKKPSTARAGAPMADLLS